MFLSNFDNKRRNEMFEMRDKLYSLTHDVEKCVLGICPWDKIKKIIKDAFRQDRIELLKELDRLPFDYISREADEWVAHKSGIMGSKGKTIRVKHFRELLEEI